MTPRDIIETARHTLQDVASASDPGRSLRQENDELLLYVLDGLREVSILRPDLFTRVVTFTCAAGECDQELSLTVGQRVLDVVSGDAGQAVPVMNLATLDAFRPQWRSDAAGNAQNWAPLADAPRLFVIYPKAPVLQDLRLKIVATASEYGLDDDITDVPESLQPALVDYVVARAESKDDEHVTSNRQAASYAAFRAKLGIK